MNVRQEQSTPIGDFYHDSGILKVLSKIEGTVDEFEVDTSELIYNIDESIAKLKSLKAQVQKVEKAWEKHLRDIEASKGEL